MPAPFLLEQVVQERKLLNHKLLNLRDFLNTTEANINSMPKDVTVEELALLNEQLIAMYDYRRILDERIVLMMD